MNLVGEAYLYVESSHWSCIVLIADINIRHAKYIINQHTTVSSLFFYGPSKCQNRGLQSILVVKRLGKPTGEYMQVHILQLDLQVSFLCQPGKTLNLSFHTKFLNKLSYNSIQRTRFPYIFKYKANPSMQTICKHYC